MDTPKGIIFSDIDFGSLPAWVSAVVTSFAFIVAARSYARSVKVHREEQARLIYSKQTRLKFYAAGRKLEILPNDSKIGVRGGGSFINPGASLEEEPHEIALCPVIQLTATIHNGSKELIGPAKLQIVNVGRKMTYDSFSAVIDVIEPESEYPINFIWPNDDYPAEPSLSTTLIFRDATGQWWRRHRAEPIEAVHDDPENYSYTPTERAQFAANAVAMGITPSPEPSISVRVRWHRLFRRMNGKSPIP